MQEAFLNSEDPLSRWLHDPTIGRLVTAAVGIALIVTVVRALQRYLAGRVRDSNARYRLRKALTFAGYIAGGFLLVGVYSDRLAGLTVAFGVAGAGIAFALQEVIASAAGWVTLSFSRFYAPGDRVQLGGIKGDVIDIGILRTTLMEIGDWVHGDLYNGRIVRVANSSVFKAPVFNYSADFPFLWDEITIPIKYGSDRALAQTIIADAAEVVVGSFSQQAAVAWEGMVRQYRIEDAQVAPMVTLVANDNWLEFTLRYVVDYRRRRNTKDQLFRRILDAIDAAPDRIGLASATFQLVGAPPLRVELTPPSGGAGRS